MGLKSWWSGLPVRDERGSRALVALSGVGLLVCGVTFLPDTEAVSIAAIVFGSALTVVSQFLNRVEGPMEFGVSGWKGTLATAERQARGGEVVDAKQVLEIDTANQASSNQLSPTVPAAEPEARPPVETFPVSVDFTEVARNDLAQYEPEVAGSIVQSILRELTGPSTYNLRKYPSSEYITVRPGPGIRAIVREGDRTSNDAPPRFIVMRVVPKAER